MRTLLVSLLFCLPCSSSAEGTDKNKPLPAAGFCIFGGQSGKPFSDLASFKAVIWKNDVIYAGGAPDRLNTQQARLEILKTMREARGARIAVGFETLDIPLQPILDEYTGGKISEEEFLRKTGWQEDSGHDFSLYRPIFDFIIQNKLKALALNAPREIILKIERKGAAGLNERDKEFIPEQTAGSKHKKYLELLKTSFSGPATAAAGTPNWDNYLAAISAWNEAAGARIADFINANPGWAVLVTSGNERLAYNAAVPASVKSRTVKLRQASFYTEDAAKCPAALPKERKDLANYVWYILPSAPVTAGN